MDKATLKEVRSHSNDPTLGKALAIALNAAIKAIEDHGYAPDIITLSVAGFEIGDGAVRIHPQVVSTSGSADAIASVMMETARLLIGTPGQSYLGNGSKIEEVN
jgi:hypothetical protein